MQIINGYFKKHAALAVSITAAILASGGTVQADEQELLEKIKKLEDRVAELEGKGPAVAAAKGSPWESWIGATKFSGYVSSSYIYNFNRAKQINGRTFDDDHHEINLNKLKLTLEKPVEFSGEKWDVGYRADLIFGEDAKVIQPLNGPTLGDAGDYEQVYLTANIPVGRGLQFSAGRMVTLMGVEVIEETANPNWSEGNQFIFGENATSTGAQLAYRWTDKLDTQVRVINGWDVVDDNNNSLSYMGRIGYAFSDRTSVAFIGYGGPEQPGNNGAWRKGIDVILNHKITPKLTAWVQGDYGHEDANSALPNPNDDADWWAAGLWLTYDFTDKVGLAVRGDYFDDADGARTSNFRGFPLFPTSAGENGQRLYSGTVTLNFKPYKGLQIRPELRWDHSDLGSGAFGSHDSPTGRKNQITALLGIAYLF